MDRLIWTSLRQCWSRWTDVRVLVKPDAVIGWHRAGFRLYWRWRSRPWGGRPKITEEIRVLIRRLAQENQGWGAPKIYGELQKLGLVVSERSAARYLRRMRRRGDRVWPGNRICLNLERIFCGSAALVIMNRRDVETFGSDSS